jgi:cytochrome P450
MPLEVHTDRNLWGEDALDFKPERFSKENLTKVHSYAYFPFVKGLRTCPGSKFAKMSMKIFISKFLLKYRVMTELKYQDLDFEMQVATKISQGYTMKVERR